MDKDTDLCRQVSGESWCHSSPTWKYLENLPLGNSEETFRNSPRYLLPRSEIFTFGLQDGMKDRLIYHRCKSCNAFLKSHQIKNHMLTAHLKQDSNSSSAHSSTSSQNKIKKPLHKSKKKIVPPPAVPPPPLFLKMAPVTTVPSANNSINVPVKENIQAPEPPVKVDDPVGTSVVPATTTNLIDVAKVLTTNLIDSKRTLSDMSPIHSPLSSLTIRGLPVTLAAVSKAPVLVAIDKPKLPLPVLKLKGITTVVPNSKPTPITIAMAQAMEALEKPKSLNRKRTKPNISSNYNPDKHCGVIDNLYGCSLPCLRAVICSNHTINERRSVFGRSKPLDTLIREYKAARMKNKPSTITTPVTIAPKASPEDVNNALQLVELIYDNKQKKVVKCVKESLLSNFDVPPSKRTSVKDEIRILRRSKKVIGKSASHSIPKLYLSINSDGEQNGEVPSTMPTVDNTHPKPLAVPTSLRRVGHTFVLQQAHRLERQRLDLQAVANQHKQLKLSSPNKTVYLVNNKHSILKNNIKNNIKVAPKRSLDKNSMNDIKNVKIIATDLNGFLLNSDVQSNNMQDKVSLLK